MQTTLEHAPRVVHGAAPADHAWQSPAQELRAGLLGQPPTIAPKFFYDARGCALYEAICEQPDYDLPRVERAILDRHQGALLALLPRDAELIDIGCGDGLKARRWLDAGIVARYIGVDIAEHWLREQLARASRRYPGVRFDGVASDLCWGFQLPLAREAGRARIFWYPGSSIGNFEPVAATRLLGQIRAHMRPGDALVLGADGPRELARMLRAYDDAAGVTADFNRNVLSVVNQTLGTALDAADFEHRAVFNAGASRIEMHLVALRGQTVALGGGCTLRLRAGEHIDTEHSYKHAPERARQLLQGAGFGSVQRFGIEGQAYGVYVASA